VEENLVLDDFIQSMLVCNQGYEVVYEPLAFATELPSVTLKDEFSRKVRIASGGFQAVSYLKKKMTLSKYPAVAFLYYSHRVFRWMPAPVCFFILLPLNVWITLIERNAFYQTILVIQTLIYLLAMLSKKFSISGKSYTFTSLIYYFFFMQIAAIAGLIKFQRTGQSAIWEKIPRNEEDAKPHDL
jgi:cellulose synthase/poly-beta-1,6-N-acetylglucosamine synthase-like glycosyltransferase